MAENFNLHVVFEQYCWSQAKSRINLEQQVLTFSDFEIRVREQAVYKNGVFIPMSHYEFFALCYLAKHPGWVFSKQQIYESLNNIAGLWQIAS